MKVVNGTISSNYGYRKHPINGQHHFHTGVDIAAPESQPVFAPVTGEIIAVGGDMWNGNFIRLQCNAHTFIFCHLKDWNVHTNDRVTTGQQIGTVGKTGQTTGPHLHFEVHYHNAPIDPNPFINF